MAQAAGYSFNTDTLHGTTVRDLAGYFLDGTIVGAAAITAGRFGYGEALHCTGGALQIPVAGGTYPINTDGGLTVAAWVILDNNTAAARCIASGKSASALDWALYASNASGNVEAVIEGTAYSSTVSIRDGSWHHVMVAVDTSHGAGNDKVQIVVDGTLVLSQSGLTTGLGYSGDATIEAGRNALSGGQPLNGIVDDFRWWNDPVDSASWPTIRDNPQTDLQLAIYAFDDGTGDDSGIYNRDLTLAGSSTFGTAMYGSGLSSTAAAASGTVAFGDVDRLAITGWMRLDTAPTGSPAPVLSIKDSGGTEKVRVVVNLDRTVTCTWVTIYGTYSVTSTVALTVGQWSRFQFAMNPTYVNIRLNAALSTITNTSNPVPHLTPTVLDLQTLYVGGDSAIGGQVSFDYVTFTQNFLDTIVDRYWAGPPVAGPTKPSNIPRGIYEFNENAGTTAADQSPSHNDLTLTAGGSWMPGIQGSALHSSGTSPNGVAARKASGLAWDAVPKGWAFSGWFKCRVGSSGARFLVMRNASGEVAHAFYLSGTFQLRLYGSSGTTGILNPNGGAVAGETWTYLAASCNGTTIQFFINGTWYAQQTYAQGSLLAPTELDVGGDTADGAVADVDSLTLFDTPLSISNVAWLFANPGAMANLPVNVTFDTAHETDTARAVAPSKALTLATAHETDSGHEFTGTKAAVLSTVTETDTAHLVAPGKDLTLATAHEVDAAYTVAAVKTVALATATEADTANPAVMSKTITLETAHELDTAYPVDVTNLGAARVLSTAHETDTAYPVVTTKTITLPTAHEIDRAFALIIQGSGAKWPVLTVSNSLFGNLEVSHGI